MPGLWDIFYMTDGKPVISIYRRGRTLMIAREQVEKALDEIRPALQRDGGNVDLVEVTEDGIVRVKLVGACAGCPMSQMTLRQGIENRLKEVIPGIKAVEGV